jgi:hypothetical protein
MQRIREEREEFESDMSQIKDVINNSNTIASLWGAVLRQGLYQESDTIDVRGRIARKAIQILKADADRLPVQADQSRAITVLVRFQKKLDMTADNFAKYSTWGNEEEVAAMDIISELGKRLGCSPNVPEILKNIALSSSKEGVVSIRESLPRQELTNIEIMALRKAIRRRAKTLDKSN